MKYQFDKHLIKYCAYITATAVAIYLSIKLLDNTMFFLISIQRFLHKAMLITKPLLIGLVIAYLFTPAVKFFQGIFERHHIFKKPSTRRTFGILLTYLIIIGVLLALICGIYLMIGGKISNNTTIRNVIDYIANYLSSNALTVQTIEEKLSSLNIGYTKEFTAQLSKILSALQTAISSSITSMFSSIVTLGSNLIIYFAAFILSIYLLQDSEYFLGIWHRFFYLVFRQSLIGKKLNQAFSIFNEIFSNYIRGQFLEACFVGIMSMVALNLIGLPDAFIIGIIAGITNMIPYVGPWIGTILGMIMAILSGNWIMAIWVFIAMQVVQQIDNNLLAPRVVGNKVGLHPVFTMVAILMGGSLGGLAGMLVAVPIFASIKTLIANWYDEYAPRIGAPLNYESDAAPSSQTDSPNEPNL